MYAFQLKSVVLVAVRKCVILHALKIPACMHACFKYLVFFTTCLINVLVNDDWLHA